MGRGNASLEVVKVSLPAACCLCAPAVPLRVLADADDAWDFDRLNMRRYRAALDSARKAVEVWKALGVDCTVQLGDIIDGRCERGGKQASIDALSTVLRVFSELPSTCPRLDVNGNHEMYNFSRWEMVENGLFPCTGSMAEELAGGA